MGKKYKLIYQRKGCIGAGACENAVPEAWEFDIDKSEFATLKSPDAIKNDDTEELVFTEELLEQYLESVQVCPVAIMEIIEVETGKKIFPEE